MEKFEEMIAANRPNACELTNAELEAVIAGKGGPGGVGLGDNTPRWQYLGWSYRPNGGWAHRGWGFH